MDVFIVGRPRKPEHTARVCGVSKNTKKSEVQIATSGLSITQVLSRGNRLTEKHDNLRQGKAWPPKERRAQSMLSPLLLAPLGFSSLVIGIHQDEQ